MRSLSKKISYSTWALLSVGILSIPAVYKLFHGSSFYSGGVQGSLFFSILGSLFLLSLKTVNLVNGFLRKTTKDADPSLKILIAIIFSLLLLVSYTMILDKVRNHYSYFTTVSWDDKKNLWKTSVTEKGIVLEESYSRYPPGIPIAPVLPPDVSMGPDGYVSNTR